MFLGRWLRQKGMTQTAFAARVGVSNTAVSRLISGTMTPSGKLVRRIEYHTKGAVTFDDWFPPYTR